MNLTNRKRDEFARAALTGILADGDRTRAFSGDDASFIRVTTEYAFDLADAMLLESERRAK